MSNARVLAEIFTQVYKDNVELYTAWKAAKRQQQPMEDEETTPPAPVTPPSGS